MKVNISSILETCGSTIRFQGGQELEISDPRLGLKLNGPVRVDGTITNTGKGFLLQADLDFEYQINCGRCLENYNTSQRLAIREQFVPENIPENDAVLDREVVYSFKGDIIDLDDCLREQVMLAFPMSFVCRPDCKGFCAICGQNLNQQSCNCKLTSYNPQFEKLKDLLLTEGGGADGKPQK